MNSVKRIGIIDLGTNSIRFDVQKIGPGQAIKCLHREKQMVRLGEGVFVKGALDPKATSRALQALARFKVIAQDLHVDRIVAFGTSTLREVRDSQKFLEKVKKHTDISLRIISGEEEAKLIAAAILKFEPHATGKYALIDIGGGSTEISLCQGNKIDHCVSFPLGAARLQQVFLRTIPPANKTGDAVSSVSELRTHIQHTLLAEAISEDWGRAKKIIGSSGTIRAISKIMKETVGTKVIHRSELSKLVKKISFMGKDQLLSIPGMEPKRVDIFLAGAILLEECMNIIDAKVVYPTSFSLRDGILLEEVTLLEEVKIKSELDLFPLFARATRLGCQEYNLKKLVINAELLFNRLSSLHKLDPRWKDYLLIATIFRDTGWAISPVGHEKHSYYILKNAELPLTNEWEVEFVAQLCMSIEGNPPNFSKSCFKGLKKKSLAKTFQILSALLSLGEALGPAHQEKIAVKKISLRANKVFLDVSSVDFAELASYRIESRAQTFQELFNVSISIGPR